MCALPGSGCRPSLTYVLSPALLVANLWSGGLALCPPGNLFQPADLHLAHPNVTEHLLVPGSGGLHGAQSRLRVTGLCTRALPLPQIQLQPRSCICSLSPPLPNAEDREHNVREILAWLTVPNARPLPHISQSLAGLEAVMMMTASPPAFPAPVEELCTGLEKSP